MSGSDDIADDKEIRVKTTLIDKNKTESHDVRSQTPDTSCWQKSKNTHSDPKNGDLKSECTICYQPLMETSDKVVLEECGHVFHSECIRVWMKQKRTCPFCAGFSLLPEEYPRLM